MERQVLILGCGFTGRRVANRMAARGFAVTVTSRDVCRLDGLPGQHVSLDVLDAASVRRFTAVAKPGCLVLHSIPAATSPEPLLQALAGRPARIVYLSTTGVYGATRDVDESTPVAPRTDRERLRVESEQAIAQGPWSWLILRPAAIYGPGRGVHASMQAGRFQLVEGQNLISRIHVDDLAVHAEAALLSDLSGAWPVADDEPCSSREVAEFCAQRLSLPMPPSIPLEQAGETRRSDRRVDGRRIRRLLGVNLKYPSYRVGIPASLAAPEP